MNVSSITSKHVIVKTQVEADEVIDAMRAVINQKGEISVSDFFCLVGHTGSFLDEKWGWRDLRNADIRSHSEGFLLELPEPEPLE